MPNSLNAKKRHRQDLVLRERNRMTRSRVRTSIRSFEDALKNKDKSGADSAFRNFVKLIDTATSKKVYHQNTSARKKSRLYKRLLTL